MKEERMINNNKVEIIHFASGDQIRINDDIKINLPWNVTVETKEVNFATGPQFFIEVKSNDEDEIL